MNCKYTLLQKYNRNLLETRKIIIISTHTCYPINFDWFSWEWSKRKEVFNFNFIFFNIADSNKLRFSKPPILKIFSPKFQRLVLGLVGLIDAKGIDMAQLYGWATVRCMLKNMQKIHFLCFQAVFEKILLGIFYWILNRYAYALISVDIITHYSVHLRLSKLPGSAHKRVKFVLKFHLHDGS